MGKNIILHKGYHFNPGPTTSSGHSKNLADNVAAEE